MGCYKDNAPTDSQPSPKVHPWSSLSAGRGKSVILQFNFIRTYILFKVTKARLIVGLKNTAACP